MGRLHSLRRAGRQRAHRSSLCALGTQLEELISKLDIESKIKDGAENLLQVFDINLKSGKEELKKQVESELHAANAKIAALSRQIEQLQTSQGECDGGSYHAVEQSHQVGMDEQGSALFSADEAHLTSLAPPSQVAQAQAPSFPLHSHATARSRQHRSYPRTLIPHSASSQA